MARYSPGPMNVLTEFLRASSIVHCMNLDIRGFLSYITVNKNNSLAVFTMILQIVSKIIGFYKYFRHFVQFIQNSKHKMTLTLWTGHYILIIKQVRFN